MKKKLVIALVLSMLLAMVFAGCQAGLTESNVTIYADGSGVKTINVMVYADTSIIPGKSGEGEGDVVGNNSKYLLVGGDELAAKIKSYAALDVEVTTEAKGEDTLVTVSYTFSSIADYFDKTKTLAKDNASLIEEPTFTDNGDGTFTYKENTENTKNSIDNIFFSLYNDPEAFSKDGQGDCNLEEFGYDYKCIYTIISESATVGDQTTTVTVNVQDETGNPVEQDWADYIEVTGTPTPVATEPAPTESAPAATEPAPTEPTPANNSTGLIIGIVVAVIAIAAIAFVVLKKKK